MKERFSNVLAWFGFILLVIFVSMMLPFSSWFWGNVDPPGKWLLFYGLCAVLNYAVSGRFRLLPWLKK
jgi:hypothetical protein